MHPFLKWAGGKRQLLHELRSRYPHDFRRYIEPFVGSGAVFFDLCGSGTLGGRDAWLIDDNPDLIGCYQMVRDHTEGVIAELETLAAGHRAGGDAHYYRIRDDRFNPPRLAGDVYTPELAAMLIYLNHTGFNGLFRLNRHGGFNVPAGRYVNPRICDAEHLRAVAAVLRDPRVAIERGSFRASPGRGGGGRFRLLRSAVRTAEQDGVIRELHRRGIFRRRSGPPATGRDRGRTARRVRDCLELQRSGHPAALRGR
jgi:DNA adenine methylase